MSLSATSVMSLIRPKKKANLKSRAERDKEWADFAASMAEICQSWFWRMEQAGQKPSVIWAWRLSKKLRSQYSRPCFTVSQVGKKQTPFFHIFADGTLYLSETPGYYFNTVYRGIAIDLLEAMDDAEKKTAKFVIVKDPK